MGSCFYNVFLSICIFSLSETQSQFHGFSENVSQNWHFQPHLRHEICFTNLKVKPLSSPEGSWMHSSSWTITLKKQCSICISSWDFHSAKYKNKFMGNTLILKKERSRTVLFDMIWTLYTFKYNCHIKTSYSLFYRF